MSFNEEITKTGEENSQEYVRMHVMAFGKDGGKFIGYRLPMKVPHPDNPLQHCFLNCDIKSDTKLVINKSGEAKNTNSAQPQSWALTKGYPTNG